MKKVKALIVDDSALVRRFLSETLSGDPAIEVIATAIDPIFAFSKIMKEQPDVITLDVEMPRMDGLTFLEKLMKSHPIPVVMISSRTQKGCETTIRALELGAVDFITKPSRNLSEQLQGLKKEIIYKVKNAARANLRPAVQGGEAPDFGAEEVLAAPDLHSGKKDPLTNLSLLYRPPLVVIGASTGGVIAVNKVLQGIDPRKAAILVVLHMPEGFTTSFAKNLDAVLPYPVKEAATGDVLKAGTFHVAPGNRNMLVEKVGGQFKIVIKSCDKNDIYKPSVNKTYQSVAKAAGSHAVAVILTGMGDDGARGMFMLRQAGAYTIAQSKESCIIFGMPKRAIEMGGVTEVLHLNQIAARVNRIICKQGEKSASN